MEDKLDDNLMSQLEFNMDLIEKIVEVLINSEKYRNSQRLLDALDKLNKISTSW